MNLIKMQIKLNTNAYIIIVQKGKKTPNLKAFFYSFMSYSDLKKLLKVYLIFFKNFIEFNKFFIKLDL